MIITFLSYVGIFIAGIFSLGFLSLLYESLSLSVRIKKAVFEREMLMAKMIMRAPGNRKSPEEAESWEILQEMIKKSPQHPEIAEIEEDDSIMGVIFEGQNYPPELM